MCKITKEDAVHNERFILCPLGRKHAHGDRDAYLIKMPARLRENKHKGVEKVRKIYEFTEEMEFVKKEDVPKPNYAAWAEDKVYRYIDDYIEDLAEEEE